MQLPRIASGLHADISPCNHPLYYGSVPGTDRVLRRVDDDPQRRIRFGFGRDRFNEAQHGVSGSTAQTVQYGTKTMDTPSIAEPLRGSRNGAR